MEPLSDVPVSPLPPDRFGGVLDDDGWRRWVDVIERGQRLLGSRVIWNVNSTARGGGVAEMLQSLVAYVRGAGIDARWVVIEGNEDFFQVTKRIHNHLHGVPGDGGPLGESERVVYERALEANGERLSELVQPDDVVLLHDPQTAGLIPAVKSTGARAIWRCHVGVDLPNELSRRAWQFLTPYVSEAEGCVFSRGAYAWEGLRSDRIAIIPPSIDAFSPKNQELDPDAVEAILAAAGVVRGSTGGHPHFTREDGSPARVDRTAEMFEEEGLEPGTPFALQVSRWDRLKDPVGVIRGFAEYVAPRSDAHLIYAGPAVEAVSDDPEGREVLNEARRLWSGLPGDVRPRIHLACLPMEDAQENAAIVNALQRKADVVVQKSLAEGFGLTVAEAMWKARPVVASRIGGIQDQIVDGVSGMLIDPSDVAAYGDRVRRLLEDKQTAERMGEEAARRVRDRFLGPRHIGQYVELFEKLLSASASRSVVWPAY